LFSAPWLSDALKQRTMAVTSGAPKLELRSVAGFEFGFMDFGGLILFLLDQLNSFQ
jgi:hypothetical protein